MSRYGRTEELDELLLGTDSHLFRMTVRWDGNFKFDRERAAAYAEAVLAALKTRAEGGAPAAEGL